MKLTITFPETPDLPPQFPAISACELVAMEMRTAPYPMQGKVYDGNGAAIDWKLEKE